MAFKFVAFFGLVALANAGILPETHYISAPETYVTKQVVQPAVIKKVVHHHEQEHYEPANFEFHYEVKDEHTGDYHSRQEKADNGHITGSYQLHDADGYLRTVEYTADDHNGFVAHVHREPLKHHQAPVVKKVVEKVVAHQPAYVTKTIQVPVQPVYKTVQVQEYPHNYHQYHH